MEGISNAVEPYRQSLAYAPIGILLCAIPWLILVKITEKIPYVDAAPLRKTLLALLFTGAYVYMWTQGTNPHDAEIKTNTFGDEVFLLLGGGYYVIHTQQQGRRHVAHDFLFVVLIIAAIIHGEVAALANTYAFLVEAPNVFLMLSVFFEKFHFMTVTWALKNFSVIVYFMSNIDICDLGHSLLTNEHVPAYIKAVFLFLMIFQFLNIIEQVYGLMGSKEVPTARKSTIIQCRTYSCTSLCRRPR